MDVSETIDKLKSLENSIQNQELKLHFINFLKIFLIGFFLYPTEKARYDELLKTQNDLITSLSHPINLKMNEIEKINRSIQEGDTYLIYSQKESALDLTKEFYQLVTSIPHPIQQKISSANSDIGNLKNRLVSIKEEILSYNDQFVDKRMKKYDNLFIQPNLHLDEEQKRAIVTDDTHNLVVAGAGSGKTEVLITRIAYLIKRSPDAINPDRILALAYQKKDVNAIENRLLTQFNISVKIKTFHALGLEIVTKAQKHYENTSFPISLIKTSEFINRLYSQAIQQNSEFQNLLLKYMIHRYDSDIDKPESSFSDKKDYFEYLQARRYYTLDGTKVKSEAEREIFNFFFTHSLNGKDIRILYEHPAKWMPYTDSDGLKKIPHPDFFFPDYDIYLEHWAINENGKVPPFLSGENATEKYRQGMQKKRERFTHQTQYSLFETTQGEYFKSGATFTNLLQQKFIQELKKKYPGTEFQIERLSDSEIIKKTWENKEEVDKLSIDLVRFIKIAKTYALSPRDIQHRLINEKWSPRQKSFGSLTLWMYSAYERDKKPGEIDYEDMINQAVDLLRSKEDLFRNQFDHILIDEFHDISHQRYLLIKALMEKNENCKLFCVGDDWQGIMSFAGGDLDFFVNFDRYFDHPARTDLTMNYRSAKQIVKLGSEIIRHNSNAQLQKNVIPFRIKQGSIVIYRFLHREEFKQNYYNQMVSHCVDLIKSYIANGYDYSDFLILSRTTKHPSFMKLITHAKEMGVPLSEDITSNKQVRLVTVHKSKGLQARVIIIINVDDDLLGFPCQIENPDIFMPAIKGRNNLNDEEERRLFYVAISRAKDEVILYTCNHCPSRFIKEIQQIVPPTDVPY